MKKLFNNKKIRNTIIIILTIMISLWGYQEFVRYSIKRQIYELTHIEGQPVADYVLWVLIGEKCDLKGNYEEKYPEEFIIKPKDVPVYILLLNRIKANGCTYYSRGWGLYPHMKLEIRPEDRYRFSNIYAQDTDFFWSFKMNKFMSFSGYHYYGECDSKFYKDYPDKDRIILICKNWGSNNKDEN